MKRAFVLLMACFASIVMSAQQLHWTPVDEGLYSGSTGIIAVIQMDLPRFAAMNAEVQPLPLNFRLPIAILPC